MPTQAPNRAVGRLSLYRRLLSGLLAEKVAYVYSHELAKLAGVTAAQVRRDVMVIGFSGSPTRGYDVKKLGEAISGFLDAPQTQEVALVGIGNLGRAILAYFAGRRPNLVIVAAFDTDPAKIDRVIHGCRCYHTSEMSGMIAERRISTAIIAVPADGAKQAAEALIAAGVKGLLNFAPVRLSAPADVFVEQIDLTTSLEKVAFFARQQGS